MLSSCMSLICSDQKGQQNFLAFLWGPVAQILRPRPQTFLCWLKAALAVSHEKYAAERPEEGMHVVHHGFTIATAHHTFVKGTAIGT